ncbi:hypothetical protein RUND412_003680 [Rhizina undulata]
MATPRSLRSFLDAAASDILDTPLSSLVLTPRSIFDERQSEIATLRQQLREKEALLAVQKGERESIPPDLVGIAVDSGVKDAQIETLELKIEALELKNHHLDEKTQSLNLALDTSEAKGRAYKNEIVKLRNQLHTQSQPPEGANTHVTNETKLKLAFLEEKVKAQHTENSTLVTENKKLKNGTANLQAKIKSMEEQIEQARETHTAAQVMNTNFQALQTENTKLLASNKNLQAANGELSKKTKDLLSKLKTYENNNAALQSKQIDLANESYALEVQNQELEKQKVALLAQNDEMLNDKKRLEDELVELRTEQAKAEERARLPSDDANRAQDYENRNKKLRDEVFDLNEKNRKQTQSIDDLERENRKLVGDNSEFLREIQRLKQYNSDLYEDYCRLKKEFNHNDPAGMGGAWTVPVRDSSFSPTVPRGPKRKAGEAFGRRFDGEVDDRRRNSHSSASNGTDAIVLSTPQLPPVPIQRSLQDRISLPEGRSLFDRIKAPSSSIPPSPCDVHAEIEELIRNANAQPRGIFCRFKNFQPNPHELLKIVCGGPIEHIKMANEKSHAFLWFLRGCDARRFLAYAERELNNRYTFRHSHTGTETTVEFLWCEKPMRPLEREVVEGMMKYGRSRIFAILDVSNEIKQEKIHQDFEGSQVGFWVNDSVGETFRNVELEFLTVKDAVAASRRVGGSGQGGLRYGRGIRWMKDECDREIPSDGLCGVR